MQALGTAVPLVPHRAHAAEPIHPLPAPAPRPPEYGTRTVVPMQVDAIPVDVAVIGAGQAGLSAAYHLQRAASRRSPAIPTPGTFVVLDANATGRRLAASLALATDGDRERHPRAARVPGAAGRPAMPSRDALPPYAADYEERFALDVQRPVRVQAVRRADDDPDGRLLVETDRRHGPPATSSTRRAPGRGRSAVLPGTVERFRGRQLHVADYVSADEFAGRRVVIVGAGVSAVQLLDEISHVAETVWMTRREPQWVEEDFDIPAAGRRDRGVEDRVRRGCRPAASSR